VAGFASGAGADPGFAAVLRRVALAAASARAFASASVRGASSSTPSAVFALSERGARLEMYPRRRTARPLRAALTRADDSQYE
jgi:hypothetical protein